MQTIAHNKPYLDKKDLNAVKKVLSSGWVAQGKVSAVFEKRVSRLLKQRYAKAVSSGTAALHLALLGIGVKKGDEVILSTYTCTALLNAIYYIGAKPILCDIDEFTLGLCKEKVKKKISKRTKAIIVNHAFGIPADIKNILQLGIPVIEDCAQALGSKSLKGPLGSFGDVTICSFYATKMMATGYGGMILTNKRAVHQRILDLTDYDQRSDYKVRFNYGLSDINAALGISQLEKLNTFVKKRQFIAKRYEAALTRTDFYTWSSVKGEKPNFYRFVLGSLKPFPYYIKKLKKKKIHAISPIEPYQLLHRYLKQSSKQFPIAEVIARQLFSIPIYPALKPSEVSRISLALKDL